MSCNNRIAERINCYDTGFILRIPVLSLSGYTSVYVFNHRSAPRHHIIRIQCQILLNPHHPQICGMQFIYVHKQFISIITIHLPNLPDYIFKYFPFSFLRSHFSSFIPPLPPEAYNPVQTIPHRPPASAGSTPASPTAFPSQTVCSSACNEANDSVR